MLRPLPTRMLFWNVSIQYPADILLIQKLTCIMPVKRIHWLRARAQMQRWTKQLILVGYEMQWTVQYFRYQCGQWKKGYEDPSVTPGSGAHAHRQYAFWATLASMADTRFIKVNRVNYKSPVPIT
jgi:hypothetical protein